MAPRKVWINVTPMGVCLLAAAFLTTSLLTIHWTACTSINLNSIGRPRECAALLEKKKANCVLSGFVNCDNITVVYYLLLYLSFVARLQTKNTRVYTLLEL